MAKRLYKEDDALRNKKQKNGSDTLPGYPEYPASEDIYNIDDKVDADPEDPTKPVMKGRNDKLKGNEPDESMLLSDLDVPGSELDDEQEEIGNEDEENNYYSLSDDKLDLEDEGETEEDVDEDDIDDDSMDDDPDDPDLDDLDDDPDLDDLDEDLDEDDLEIDDFDQEVPDDEDRDYN